MAPYAAATDLVLGSVPLPTNGDATKYLAAAADEIDSVIGMRYATPVAIDSGSAVQRPVGLILKKINAWLASGRLVMAADASGADDQIQQYGKYLVDQAMKTLEDIGSGKIPLPGIALIEADTNKQTGPVAAFADDASMVEGFNSSFGNQAQNALDRQTQLPYSNYPYLPYTY